MFVGKWVGWVQEFLQTPASRPSGANTRGVLWRRPLRVFWPKAPDLMQARPYACPNSCGPDVHYLIKETIQREATQKDQPERPLRETARETTQ